MQRIYTLNKRMGGQFVNNCIADMLKRNSEELSDKVAITFENNRSVSYRELDDITNRLANGLAEIGVERGDKVAMFLPNCLEIVYSWLAINKLGALEVPINLANKGDFLSGLFRGLLPGSFCHLQP